MAMPDPREPSAEMLERATDLVIEWHETAKQGWEAENAEEGIEECVGPDNVDLDELAQRVALALDAAVAERDQQIAELTDELIARDRIMNEQSDLLTAGDQQIAALTEANRLLTIDAGALEAEVGAWRATTETERAATVAQWERAEAAYKEVAALGAVIARHQEIFKWLDGRDGDFPARQPSEGAYYWRKELNARLAAPTPPALVERAEAERKVVEAAGAARDADWSYRPVPGELYELTVAVDELRALQETRAPGKGAA